jgi:hypothetical protein
MAALHWTYYARQTYERHHYLESRPALHNSYNTAWSSTILTIATIPTTQSTGIAHMVYFVPESQYCLWRDDWAKRLQVLWLW